MSEGLVAPLESFDDEPDHVAPQGLGYAAVAQVLKMPGTVAEQTDIEPMAADLEQVEEVDVDELEASGPITDIVQRYFKEIGKVPLLTAEEEVLLAKRIEAGLFATHLLDEPSALGASLTVIEMQKNGQSVEEIRQNLELLSIDGSHARRDLVEANLRLVVWIAKRYVYRTKSMTLIDLIQEGNIGLVRAVEKFDYAKGYKFATYAPWWIRQNIQRAIADKDRAIRIPVNMLATVNKVLRAQATLEAELGREPTAVEIGDQVDMPEERVTEMLTYAVGTTSLDQPIGEDGTDKLSDFIVEDGALASDEIVDFRLMHDTLQRALSSLTSREAYVLRMRFGLDDGRARTLDEVGKTLEVTRERIRQIESKALERLRAVGSPAQELRAFQ